MSDGWTMLKSIFINFNAEEFMNVFPTLGLTNREWLIVVLSFVVVIVVSILKEKKISIHGLLYKVPTPMRWSVVYGLIFAIILFGAYGVGFDEVAMMYAGF